MPEQHTEIAREVEYREVPGFPAYKIGNDGTVLSAHKCNSRGVVTPVRGDRGHLSVVFCQGAVRKRIKIHRLVLTVFVGPCPEGMEGCHDDGNPANNHVDNLRWDTRKANHADKKKHGTHPEGERHPHSKLTEEDVVNIRAMHQRREMSIREMSRRYKIARGAIQRIVHNRGWTFVGVRSSKGGAKQ